MKSILLLFALGLSAHAAEWRLVWSDDFDGSASPDPAKWAYEKGFERNKELQYYTANRSENARVENGKLILEARHETIPNPAYQEGATEWNKTRKEAHFTSASLTTKGLKTFRYGKIEVRAKLPAGKGVWPAIWLLGNRGDWPAAGEIDIMEFVTHKPGVSHCCLHFNKPGTTEHQMKGGSTKSTTLHDEFHVYGVDWNEKAITFLFDGQPVQTTDLDVAGTGSDNPFRKTDSFYLILNLAIGGLWGEEPDPTVYPQKFEIDWVKAWEK